MIPIPVRAELFALARRPGLRVMAAVWLLQVVVFAYAISYLIVRLVPDLPAAEAANLLAGLAPANVGGQLLGSMPVYGGPVMLIIGTIVAAGDYRFGTLRTIVARCSSRSRFVAGRFASLVITMLGLTVLTVLLGAACSAVIAAIEGAPLGFAGPGEFGSALAALWLVCVVWAGMGFALGTATRSVAGAIGLGLLWTLVVENVVTGLANVLPALALIRLYLVSGATGSLAGTFGGQGPPGVVPNGNGQVAVAVLVGYLLASLLLSTALFAKRDLD